MRYCAALHGHHYIGFADAWGLIDPLRQYCWFCIWMDNITEPTGKTSCPSAPKGTTTRVCRCFSNVLYDKQGDWTLVCSALYPDITNSQYRVVHIILWQAWFEFPSVGWSLVGPDVDGPPKRHRQADNNAINSYCILTPGRTCRSTKKLGFLFLWPIGWLPFFP